MSNADGSIIILTEIDTQPYNRGLREMENSARSFSGNLSSILKRGMVAVGFGISAKEIANLTGIMTDLESRAKVASKGLEDTGMIMDRLRDIADRAYSPLEATATAFMNNSTALNALGMSMKEQLDITDSLTNAMIVAGAKGEQFEMVMNTVNRSLAVGVMRNQELEMIQKYGGTVAEALARQLGTNVTGLKEYAQQGKITAQVISDALVGSMELFRQQAEDMPATIGDSMVRLRNQVMVTLHELNSSMDFEQTAVRAIDTLKESLVDMQGPLETLVPLGTTFFVTVLGGKAVAAAVNYTKAQVAMTKAIIAETQAERASLTLRNQLQATDSRYTSQRARDAALRQAQSAQNLAAVQNEIQAEISRQRFVVQSAVMEVSRTEARVADTRAALAQLQATLRLTDAEARRHVMGRNLYRLEMQLAEAKARHTAATTALNTANNALTASSARAATAMTGLRAAGASVLAMFGGPWGLALTAAAVGVYYLATRQSEGEKVAQRYGKELEKLREKYGWVRDAASEAGEEVKNLSKSQLSLQINIDTKSLENLDKDLAATLSNMRREFTKTAGGRGGVGSFVGALFGEHEIKQGFMNLEAAFKEGRRDLAPEIDAFEELIVKRFGKDIPEKTAKSLEKLKDEILAIEQLETSIKFASDVFNSSLSKVGEIDWSPVLNRQKSFSEQLIAQLEDMGIRVKGLKLLDITDSVSSLESSQKKFTEIMSQMVTSTEEELARLRKMMEETYAAGKDVPEKVYLLKAELVKRRADLNTDLYNALAAQRAKFLAEERVAMETSLSDKKLSVQKEVEIRKKAAEDIVRAMASQGEVTREVLAAIVDVTGASDNLGAAQREVAQAAANASVALAQAQVTVAAMGVAAAAATGDIYAMAQATFTLAAASAALANAESNAEAFMKDFKITSVGGGGGGRRGGGGGGIDEKKKSLEEIELILARLNGDFEKIKQIEANRELERFIDLVKKAGLSSSEAAAKIEEFKNAQGSQINTENIQTLIQFYDELRGILPQAATEFQNLNAILIENKAQAYLAAGANKELVEVWKELQGLMTSQDWEAGVKRSAQTFINEWTDAAKVAEKAMNIMITGFQDLASGVVDSLFDGAEFRADKFLKDLGKKLLTLALNQAIAGLMKFFGFGVAHGGGIVGMDVIAAGAPMKMASPLAFIGAKKYHAGGIVGLASTEVPAILQKGEGVFTAAQMKALAPADSMSFRQDIKIVNPPGVPLTATTQNSRSSNGTLQTSVMLRSVEDGLANRMKTGESKLTPTLEGKYGLNSARGAHLRTGGS